MDRRASVDVGAFRLATAACLSTEAVVAMIPGCTPESVEDMAVAAIPSSAGADTYPSTAAAVAAGADAAYPSTAAAAVVAVVAVVAAGVAVEAAADAADVADVADVIAPEIAIRETAMGPEASAI